MQTTSFSFPGRAAWSATGGHAVRVVAAVALAALAACSDVSSGPGPVPPADEGEWRNLGRTLERTYFNPDETTITKAT
ncbi:MAG: hypothetical protein ACKOCT_21750, partial [Alphaproteobacteria bacterium]